MVFSESLGSACGVVLCSGERCGGVWGESLRLFGVRISSREGLSVRCESSVTSVMSPVT